MIKNNYYWNNSSHRKQRKIINNKGRTIIVKHLFLFLILFEGMLALVVSEVTLNFKTKSQNMRKQKAIKHAWHLVLRGFHVRDIKKLQQKKIKLGEETSQASTVVEKWKSTRKTKYFN